MFYSDGDTIDISMKLIKSPSCQMKYHVIRKHVPEAEIGGLHCAKDDVLKCKITEKNIQRTTSPSEFAKNVSKDNEMRDWSTAPEPPQYLKKMEEEVSKPQWLDGSSSSARKLVRIGGERSFGVPLCSVFANTKIEGEMLRILIYFT